MTTRVLDRVPSQDERNKLYPIRELLDQDAPRSYTWRCDTYLDQGSEGACVGYAWAHEAAAVPKKRPADYQLAQAIYRRAQEIDEWPGEGYSGTSVLAGAKAAKERGMLIEYRWAFTIQDVVRTISRHGPIVLGINWYEGMWDTDDKGLIHVTGHMQGGHAILARGVSVKQRTVTLHNSWGKEWGVDGKAKISWDDLERLLDERGDACVPVVR